MRASNPSPIVMWVFVLSGAGLLLQLPNTPLWPAILLWPVGFIVWVAVLARSLSEHRQAAKSTNAINKLITTGPYQYVRHPIYAADCFFALTIFLSIPQLNVLLAIVWAITVWVFWAKREEQRLQQRFPQYKQYKKRVPGFIPFLKQ